MRIFHYLSIVISLLPSLPAICQIPGQGDYLYRNFTSQELKASDWIQSITQDNRGIIYAGNNLGNILEYDGSRWRSIPATNGPIRSLKTDRKGRIYVGSFGDFGYLEPTRNGIMQYHSLKHLASDEDKNISDVWSIEVFGDDIYFRTVERLFRYRNGNLTAFRNKYGWFGNLISLDGQLYVTIDYSGVILRIEADSLVRFFESKEFASVAFGASAPYKEHKKLIGSWGGGVFVFCPENINKPGRKVIERISSPKAPANKNLLNALEVYQVEPGIYAARTNNGITVFNSEGEETIFLSTQNGLNSSLIETVFSDRNQVLWIGTEKGITRIDISSPISSWYSFSESTGTVWGIISHNKSIYFWGINGIFELRNNKAEKINQQTYGLVEFYEPGRADRAHLLAINSNSLVEITNNRLNTLITFPERLLYQQIFISKLHPDRIYLYGANGLYLIRFDNGKWIWEDNIAGINVGIQSFSEDQNGDLWLAVSNNRELIRLMPEKYDSGKTGASPAYFKQQYNPPPEVGINWVKCFTVGNRTLFGTEKGLFHFNRDVNRFVPDSTLGKRFTDGLHAVFTLKEGPDGAVFIADRVHRFDDLGLCLPQDDGTYKWYNRPFLGWTAHIRIYDASFDSDGSVWMATDEGLNKFDPSKDRKIPGEFNTLIREVITGTDSILFYGNYPATDSGVISLTQPDFAKPELTQPFNSIRFGYTATSYEGEDQNVYQYMLEGFDKEWSNWNTSVAKEYSNLPDGDFVFRVRARNVYGNVSDEAVYYFSILPPWYRTLWAYIGYLLVLCLLVYGIIQLNIRRLQKANLLLEKSVKERTAEVVRQKEEISSINENLLVQQEELKTTVDTLYDMQEQLIRSEKMANLGQLIAGIAHEINSPLGAIKASVSDISNNSRQILQQLPELIKKLNDDQFRLFLELVDRSATTSIPSSSRDERLFKKSLQKQLEDKNLPDAAFKADTLVDMGIHGDIDAFVGLLGNGNADSLQVAYQLSQLIRNTRNIETAIDRASKMVLALKHYSHNTGRDEKTEANISEGIITVLTLYQNQLKHRIHLITEFEPIPKIYCYPDELNQVWTNLITNAIDAMEGRGQLSISVSRSNDWVIVKLADTGKGIPESIQPRIFDAFFSTKPPGEGSGLGLFLIKEIIDKHGGKIVFETSEGKGTTFIVSLPLLTRLHKN